jgi:hypothetical protein
VKAATAVIAVVGGCCVVDRVATAVVSVCVGMVGLER